MESTESTIDDSMESTDSLNGCISESQVNSTEFTFDEFNTGLYKIPIGFLELVTKKVDNETMRERLGSMVMGKSNETARDLLSSVVMFQWPPIVLLSLGLLLGAACLIAGLCLACMHTSANSRANTTSKCLLIAAQALLAIVALLGCLGIYMFVVGMANLYKTLDATTLAVNATSQYFQHIKTEALGQLNCLTNVAVSEAHNELKGLEQEIWKIPDTLFVRYDFQAQLNAAGDLVTKTDEISEELSKMKIINDSITQIVNVHEVLNRIQKDIVMQQSAVLDELKKKISKPIHDVKKAYDQSRNSAQNIFFKTGVLIDQLKNVMTTAIGYVKQLQDMEGITKPIGAATIPFMVVYQIFFFLAIGLAIVSHMKNYKIPSTDRGKLSNRLGFVVYACAAIVLLSLWFIMLVSSAFFSASVGVQFGCDTLFGDTNLTLFSLKPFGFKLPDMNGTMQPIFLKNLIKGCKEHPEQSMINAFGIIDLIDGEELLSQETLRVLEVQLVDIADQLPMDFKYNLTELEKAMAEMKRAAKALRSAPIQSAQMTHLRTEMTNLNTMLEGVKGILGSTVTKSEVMEEMSSQVLGFFSNSKESIEKTADDFQMGLNDTVRCAPLYEQFTQLGDSVCVPFARSLSLVWAGSGLVGLTAVFGVVGMHFVFGSLLFKFIPAVYMANLDRERKKTEESKTGTDGKDTTKDTTTHTTQQ